MRQFSANDFRLGAQDPVTGLRPISFARAADGDVAWVKPDGRGGFHVISPESVASVFAGIAGVRLGGEAIVLATVADLVNRRREFFLGWFERAKFASRSAAAHAVAEKAADMKAAAAGPVVIIRTIASDPLARPELDLLPRLKAIAADVTAGKADEAIRNETAAARLLQSGPNILLVADTGPLAALAMAWEDGLDRLLTAFPSLHLPDMVIEEAHGGRDAWWHRRVSTWLEARKGGYIWLETPPGRTLTAMRLLWDKAGSPPDMCPIASGQEDIALAAALDAYRQALKPDERLIVLADQARLRRRAAESDLAPQLLSTAALLGLLQGSEDSPWPAISSADQFDDPGSGGPEVDKGRENIALLKPPGPPASATGRQGGSGQTGTRGIPSAVRPGSRQ